MLDRIALALVDLLVSIDTASEEQIDSDFASEIQGAVANVFDSLTEEERGYLAGLVDRAAEREEVEARREVLTELPQDYGLRDDD